MLRCGTIGTGQSSEVCRERAVVLRARWGIPRATFAARAEGAGRNGRVEERYARLEGRDGRLDRGWCAGAIEWSAPREAAITAAPFGVICKEGSGAPSAPCAFDSTTAAAHQSPRSRFFSAHQALRRRGNRTRRRPGHRLAGACDADAIAREASCRCADDSAESGPGQETIRCSQRSSRSCLDSADLEIANSRCPACGRHSCCRSARRAIAGGSSVHWPYIAPSGRRSEH